MLFLGSCFHLHNVDKTGIVSLVPIPPFQMTSHERSDDDNKESTQARTSIQTTQRSVTNAIEPAPQPNRDRFSKKEKWSIVVFTAFVGFFRLVAIS